MRAFVCSCSQTEISISICFLSLWIYPREHLYITLVTNLGRRFVWLPESDLCFLSSRPIISSPNPWYTVMQDRLILSSLLISPNVRVTSMNRNSFEGKATHCHSRNVRFCLRHKDRREEILLRQQSQLGSDTWFRDAHWKSKAFGVEYL